MISVMGLPFGNESTGSPPRLKIKLSRSKQFAGPTGTLKVAIDQPHAERLVLSEASLKPAAEFSFESK
jgi:hypothetical protein